MEGKSNEMGTVFTTLFAEKTSIVLAVKNLVENLLIILWFDYEMPSMDLFAKACSLAKWHYFRRVLRTLEGVLSSFNCSDERCGIKS